MTNEEREDRILKKLDSVEAALNSQLLAVREEIAALNKRQGILSAGHDELLSRQKRMSDRQNQLEKIAQEHSDEIAALIRRVDALAENQENVLWRSKDKTKFGLDKQRVYKMFDDFGVEKSLGLLLLDAGHKLCVEESPSGPYRTKNIWIKGSGKATRAIVIISE